MTPTDLAMQEYMLLSFVIPGRLTGETHLHVIMKLLCTLVKITR